MDPKELHARAKSLAVKFKQGCERTHIDEAIALDREALELRPPCHPARSISLIWLSHHLDDRYGQYGEMIDLEEAIVLGRDALALCPPGNPNHSVCLQNLGWYLSRRYQQLGAVVDLNEAIVLSRDALALSPPGHPARSVRLSNLGMCLSNHYKQLGVMVDLDEAVVLGRDALALCPPGHPDRSKRLNDLGAYLSDRHNQLGAIVDIDEAIVLARDSLVLCPPGHPDRSAHLDNLGVCLSARYSRLREIVDLNEAIVLGRDALALCPPGRPDRSIRLNNLGARLSDRYRQLGVIVDLNESIVLARDALALCPPGHPYRSMRLNNLGNRLSDRHKKLGAIEDINEAIVLSRDALELSQLGHPLRSWLLESLAFRLRTRFTRSSQSEDKEEFFDVYTQLSHIPPTTSSGDLSAARAWISAAEDFRHPSTLLAYETTLRLLIHHLATLPSLPQHLDTFKKLTSSLTVDAFSACLRNHSPTKAIELLEQGRGVFWNQRTRLRSPLHDVIASGEAGKTLSDRFTQLTSSIRNTLESPGTDQHDHVCHLNAELEGVVADIRKLPGLSHFLLPSLFSDLQKSASGGPVIIVNASKYSCDALIVVLDQDPIHIPLQITRDRVREMTLELHRLIKRTKLEDVARYFAEVLRELWGKVVSPIVDVLQTIHPPQSRIWWCPTAEFSLLPLHAAGSYRKGQKKLSDLYISSYTSTLTALIRARGHGSLTSTFGGPHFVAIGQAEAAGQSELQSVGAELANIGERVKSFATFRSIEGSESCISQVVEELNKTEWVHLACHGLPNWRQPFESAFALHDGHFTIERIIQCEAQKAQFAYLSACHTTVGDEECPDEMIHLASAMQFVGFRSVIGTMWAVDDDQTKKVTSMFYDNIIDESGRLDYTRAAFALHKMMWTLRDVSFDQRILYIHLGA